jgi:hypothetical protein
LNAKVKGDGTRSRGINASHFERKESEETKSRQSAGPWLPFVKMDWGLSRIAASASKRG